MRTKFSMMTFQWQTRAVHDINSFFKPYISGYLLECEWAQRKFASAFPRWSHQGILKRCDCLMATLMIPHSWRGLERLGAMAKVYASLIHALESHKMPQKFRLPSEWVDPTLDNVGPSVQPVGFGQHGNMQPQAMQCSIGLSPTHVSPSHFPTEICLKSAKRDRYT